MSAWIPFSDYDLWKTREPEEIPRREDFCAEPECRHEAEYEGYCEAHWSERRWQLAEDDMPENEWGMIL
jgi:hypothetical protein